MDERSETENPVLLPPSAAAVKRGVTRLCHFTPSRNLPHIVRDGFLRSTKEMTADARSVYNQTDLARLDGHPDMISATIEFPNAYYLARAVRNQAIFKEFVLFFLEVSLIDDARTLFSPRNAAAGHGAYLVPGLQGYEAMYADSVRGAYDRIYRRQAARPTAAPTDEQAEVMLHAPIPLTSVVGVGFPTVGQAGTEVSRLRQAGLGELLVPHYVAPDLFDATTLTRHLSSGSSPTVTLWPVPDREVQ